MVFALVLPLIQPVIVLGTTIVAIKTPSEMYVAADSKMTVLYTDGRIIEEKICKIHQANDLFFTHAGLMEDERGLFSAPSIVVQARRAGGTILDTVKIFEKLVERPLSRFWDWYRDHHLRQYEEYLRQRSARVAFFGVENQTPVLYLRDLQMQTSSTGSHQVRIERHDCPPKCPRDGPQLTIISAGSNSPFEFMGTNPDYWKTHDPVQTIIKLIELDILAAPDKSDGPIDILQLDRRGTRWVQKKDECLEIRTYKP